MSKLVIEAEADTLEEARALVKSQIPEGLHWLSEQIISDGEPNTLSIAADTMEAAFAKAQSALPADATVLEKKERTQPGQRMIKVEAFDEPSARSQIQAKLGDTEIVRALKLIASGKKGFFGVGKTPHQFEAEVFQRATSAIIYRQKAKLLAEIGTGKKTVSIVLRDFLLAKKDEIEAAQTSAQNARILGMGGSFAFSTLGFLDVIKNLMNSNFSQEQVQRALHHPNKLISRLAAEFLAEVKKWC